MKINSYLILALVVILFSYTLADVSKQETTPQKAKEAADGKVEAKEAAAGKVEAKGDGGKYSVNYGGGGGGNYGGGGGGGGSGWGGGCHHGCCYRGYGGSCNKCCSSPEEAKALSENQAGAKQATDTNKVEATGEEGQYGVNYGGGGGNYGGGGGGGGSGWGGGCRHGCCYRGYRGSCKKCCSSPEEAKALSENQAGAKQATDTNKVEATGEEGQYGVNYGGGGGNYGGGGGGGGSGWGGGCRHGCCYRGYGGSCNKCCSSPEEAKGLAKNQEEAKQPTDTNKVEAKGDEGQYGVNYGGGGGGNYGGGGGGGGSGWGGGCRHGCCYRGYRGSCNKCCSSPEEAKAFAENQSRP